MTTASLTRAATATDERAASTAIPAIGWLALGVLFTALSAQRFHIGLLGWVSAVPWLVFLRTTDGWKTRVVFLFALQVGMAIQIAKIVSDPIPLAFVPMFSAPMALSAGVLFVLFETWRRHLGDAWGLALFPAIAVVSEWIGWRTSDFGTWGAAAYTQLDNLPLLQTASLVGISGIAWLTSASSALIAVWISDEQPRRWVPAATGLALLIAGAHFYGAARLVSHPDSELVTVAAVVTDVGLDGSGLPPRAELDAATDALFARSERAADHGAQLVVWNEGATAVQPDREGTFLARGQDLATRRGIDLVLAYVVPVDGMRQFENKYVWLSPQGEIETYFKHHPVPSEGSIRGTDPIVVHDRPYGSAAGAICYDYDFPGLALEHARGGAGLVFVPSSDWAGIDPTHTWMARVRGIEGGFSVLRPVRWATSAAFDAYGRPLAQMPWQDTDRTMLARVPIDPVPTLYAKIGDALPIGCVGVLIFGVGGLIRRRVATSGQGRAASDQLPASS